MYELKNGVLMRGQSEDTPADIREPKVPAPDATQGSF